MTDGNDKIAPLLETELYQNSGLTKREYFAAMAMQGILANSVELELHKANGGYIIFERIAIRAAQAADDLIKELNK